MTDLKISELEDGGSSQAADAIPIARSGQNYYVTSQYLKNFVFGSNGTISIAAGKTFSVNNTITLNGNDGVSVNFGSGGTFLYSGGALGTPSSGTLTNVTGLPLTTGVTGVLPVVNGGTGITSFGTGVATAFGQNVTGSGGIVLENSPTLITPALGTPSSATLTNATGLPISTGVSGLGTGVATFLATPSSANLATAVTDETGSGPLVFATTPVFTSSITLGAQSTTRGSIILANTAAGTKAVTLQSSNSTVSSYTLTLPTTAGTNGYFLQTDGVGNLAWAAGGGGGGGGTVAGSDKQIQFNDAGSFGASANFLFDKTTYMMTLGLASTATGMIAFGNASSTHLTKIRAGNAAASVTYTLPTNDGAGGQALTTDGSGVLSWASISSGLTVGTTSITGGTSGRILYDNAGVLGEKVVTGTGDVVLATSPTLVTPALGTPTSGNFSTGTFTWPTFNQNTTGTAAGLSSTLVVGSGGTGLTSGTSGGVLYYSASNTLASSAALAANSLVIGGGAGVAPSTTTTGTGVLTALGTNVGTAGAFVVNGGALGTPLTGTLTNCTSIPVNQATGTLAVANGGTGITSFGTGVATFLATPSSANLAAAVTDETGTGSLVFSNSPTFNDDITLGVASTATGVAIFKGVTSGTVSLSVADAAGTWTMKLPTTAGTSSQALTTDGSGNTTWSTITGGATGGGSDAIFWNNGQTVTTNYSIPSATNAGSFGPISIDAGIVVQIPANSSWTII